MKFLPSLLLLVILSLPSNLVAGEAFLLAVGDTHAKWQNLAKLAVTVKVERKQHPSGSTITIDAGDTMQGSYAASASAGDIPMRIMNHIGVDIWVPGNHDFEMKPYRFHEFKGTVLSANWSSKTFTPVPWTVRRINGVKIAFIGLGEHNLYWRILPSCGVNYENPAAALRRVMPEVRKVAADFNVLICHDGEFFRSGSLRGLLKAYPEIDVVIGAHNHQLQRGKNIINGTFFLQSGRFAEHLAVIKLQTSPRRISAEMRSVAATPAAVFPAALRNRIAAAEAGGEKICGRTQTVLTRQADSPFMRNEFADILGRALCRATGADCAVYGIFSSSRTLTSTTVKMRDIYTLLSYEDRVCHAELTPDELRTLLRREYPDRASLRRRSIILSAIELRYDARGRLCEIELPPPRANGKIRLALSDYHAAGNGGYAIGTRTQLADKLIESGVLLRTAFSAELEAGESN